MDKDSIAIKKSSSSKEKIKIEGQKAIESEQGKQKSPGKDDNKKITAHKAGKNFEKLNKS